MPFSSSSAVLTFGGCFGLQIYHILCVSVWVCVSKFPFLIGIICYESESEVMSNSLRPHGLQPTRFLCPWDPSPGDLPNPGIEPGSPTLQADALTSEPPGKSYQNGTQLKVLSLGTSLPVQGLKLSASNTCLGETKIPHSAQSQNKTKTFLFVSFSN